MFNTLRFGLEQICSIRLDFVWDRYLDSSFKGKHEKKEEVTLEDKYRLQ